VIDLISSIMKFLHQYT